MKSTANKNIKQNASCRRRDKIRKGSAAAAIMALFLPSLFAAGEPMAFLKLGASARPAGMAGAYLAVADDASAIFYNPAGIAQLDRPNITADVYFMTFGRHVNNVSLAAPFNLGGVKYGAGLSWFNYSAGSDIEIRSTNSTSAERLASDSSHFFFLSASAALSPVFMAGINAKMDLRFSDGTRAFGFGFDAGALAKLSENMKIAFCARNLGANTAWEEHDYMEKPSQSYLTGFSWYIGQLPWPEHASALLSADIEAVTFGEFIYRIGVETGINRMFFIRAGFDGTLSMGCGAFISFGRTASMRFDYAFSFDRVIEGGLNHRAGIVFEIEMPKASLSAANGAVDEERPW